MWRRGCCPPRIRRGTTDENTGGGGAGGGGDPLPSLTSVSPGAGFTTGGGQVRITGANFAGVPVVTIGGVAATNVTLVDDATLTATTPPGAAGDAAVDVTTAGGTASGDLFTYVDYPPTSAGNVQVDDEGPPNPARSVDAPFVYSDGRHVYVVWTEARSHATHKDVFFQRSSDRGETWLPADVRLDTNAAGASGSSSPHVRC